MAFELGREEVVEKVQDEYGDAIHTEKVDLSGKVSEEIIDASYRDDPEPEDAEEQPKASEPPKQTSKAKKPPLPKTEPVDLTEDEDQGYDDEETKKPPPKEKAKKKPEPEPEETPEPEPEEEEPELDNEPDPEVVAQRLKQILKAEKAGVLDDDEFMAKLLDNFDIEKLSDLEGEDVIKAHALIWKTFFNT